MIKVRKLSKGISLLLALLLAASCSHKKSFIDPQFIYAHPSPSLNSSDNAPIAKSQLRVGDSFLFNNPDKKWTVTGLAGGKVSWRSDSGDYLQTTLSTLLPPVRWGGGGDDLSSGRSELVDLKGIPITLTAGYKFSFTEDRYSIRPPDFTKALWQCVVGETSLILVPAGKVEAAEVVCNRNGQEKVLMNYAQSLGHYVRQVIATEKGPVIRELVTYARGKQ